MSQGYAIELYFDPSMENQVLKSWNALPHREITAHLIEIGSRPHITLFSSSSQFIDPLKLQTLIKNFATKQESFNLDLSSIGQLTGGESSVMFLSPTPTLSLLQLHSQLCDLLRKEGFEIAHEFTVDSWMPLCAVAQDMPKNRVAKACDVLMEMKLPITGCAMDIGLVELSPVRELCSFALGNSAELWSPEQVRETSEFIW